MASDLTFSMRGVPTTVNWTEATWSLDPGTLQLKPATFRILKDIFGTKLIPHFLVYFGSWAEKITFEVNFPTDAAWKAFRKYVKNDSYFTNGTNYVSVQWGAAGDSFNGTWEDTESRPASVGNAGVGIWGPIRMTRKIPANTWEGTVDFYLGIVIQA